VCQHARPNVAAISLTFIVGLQPWTTIIVGAEVAAALVDFDGPDASSSWRPQDVDCPAASVGLPSRADGDGDSGHPNEPTSGATASERPDANDANIRLVRIEKLRRSSPIASFVTWVGVMFAWTSLIWLPFAAVGVVVRVVRRGTAWPLCATILSIVGLYVSPSVTGGLHVVDSRGAMTRCILSWFDSVELWAAEGSLQRPRSQPTLLCYHPHGIFSVGACALALGGPGLFPDGLSVFTAPYIKHFAPLMHACAHFMLPMRIKFESVSKANMHSVMSKRVDALFLVPGGIQEATLTKAGRERLFLKRRKGFVKYALQHGYSLTPVYAFGETDVYDNLQAFMKWRLKLNEGIFGSPQGIPTVAPFGWRWCPILPKRRARLRVVIGPPLQLPHIRHPKRDEVEYWQAIYIQAVEKLYAASLRVQIGDDRPLEVM